MEDDIVSGNGLGFEDKNGTICMIRCFECGSENYAMAVASGQCSWCGYNPNVPKEEKVTKN